LPLTTVPMPATTTIDPTSCGVSNSNQPGRLQGTGNGAECRVITTTIRLAWSLDPIGPQPHGFPRTVRPPLSYQWIKDCLIRVVIRCLPEFSHLQTPMAHLRGGCCSNAVNWPYYPVVSPANLQLRGWGRQNPCRYPMQCCSINLPLLVATNSGVPAGPSLPCFEADNPLWAMSTIPLAKGAWRFRRWAQSWVRPRSFRLAAFYKQSFALYQRVWPVVGPGCSGGRAVG